MVVQPLSLVLAESLSSQAEAAAHTNKNKWALSPVLLVAAPLKRSTYQNSYVAQFRAFVCYHMKNYQTLKPLELPTLLEVKHEHQTLFR